MHLKPRNDRSVVSEEAAIAASLTRFASLSWHLGEGFASAKKRAFARQGEERAAFALGRLSLLVVLLSSQVPS